MTIVAIKPYESLNSLLEALEHLKNLAPVSADKIRVDALSDMSYEGMDSAVTLIEESLSDNSKVYRITIY